MVPLTWVASPSTVVFIFPNSVSHCLLGMLSWNPWWILPNWNSTWAWWSLMAENLVLQSRPKELKSWESFLSLAVLDEPRLPKLASQFPPKGTFDLFGPKKFIPALDLEVAPCAAAILSPWPGIFVPSFEGGVCVHLIGWKLPHTSIGLRASDVSMRAVSLWRTSMASHLSVLLRMSHASLPTIEWIHGYSTTKCLLGEINAHGTHEYASDFLTKVPIAVATAPWQSQWSLAACSRSMRSTKHVA